MFVWFMQYGSNVGRDLYLVIGEVQKTFLNTVVVGMVIPCSFPVWHLFVFPITVHRKVCLQISGQGGLSKVGDKSHFCIACSFLCPFGRILSTNGLSLWCIWVYMWPAGCWEDLSVKLCCCTDGWDDMDTGMLILFFQRLLTFGLSSLSSL